MLVHPICALGQTTTAQYRVDKPAKCLGSLGLGRHEYQPSSRSRPDRSVIRLLSRLRSQLGEERRPDRDLLDLASLHTEFVALEQLAQTMPVYEVNGRRPIARRLFLGVGSGGSRGDQQTVSARPAIAPRKSRTAPAPTPTLLRYGSHWKKTGKLTKAVHAEAIYAPSPLFPVTFTLSKSARSFPDSPLANSLTGRYMSLYRWPLRFPHLAGAAWPPGRP